MIICNFDLNAVIPLTGGFYFEKLPPSLKAGASASGEARSPTFNRKLVGGAEHDLQVSGMTIELGHMTL